MIFFLSQTVSSLSTAAASYLSSTNSSTTVPLPLSPSTAPPPPPPVSADEAEYLSDLLEPSPGEAGCYHHLSRQEEIDFLR